MDPHPLPYTRGPGKTLGHLRNVLQRTGSKASRNTSFTKECPFYLGGSSSSLKTKAYERQTWFRKKELKFSVSPSQPLKRAGTKQGTFVALLSCYKCGKFVGTWLSKSTDFYPSCVSTPEEEEAGVGKGKRLPNQSPLPSTPEQQGSTHRKP